MDVVSYVIGFSGIVIAAWSLVYSRAAARRATAANELAVEANRVAGEALAHEARVDARQREYRFVAWELSYEYDSTAPAVFVLRNIGDTDAETVTVVLRFDPERELHKPGGIAAGASARIPATGAAQQWMRDGAEFDVLAPGFKVHWSSPLGQVDEFESPLRSIDSVFFVE